jgi:hypothetical protein
MKKKRKLVAIISSVLALVLVLTLGVGAVGVPLVADVDDDETASMYAYDGKYTPRSYRFVPRPRPRMRDLNNYNNKYENSWV